MTVTGYVPRLSLQLVMNICQFSILIVAAKLLRYPCFWQLSYHFEDVSSPPLNLIDYVVHSPSVAAGAVQAFSDSPAVEQSGTLAMACSIAIGVDPIIAH